MTENDNRKPGLHRAPPDSIPPFLDAAARFQDPARQVSVQTMKKGSDNEWDTWKASIEHGRRSKFENILDFFVNLPSLQDALGDSAVTAEWYWNAIEPELLASRFYYRPEIVRLLKIHAGSDATITEGWLVRYESGRIDTETTWSDASYLVGTDGYFAYIQLYTEQIH